MLGVGFEEDLGTAKAMPKLKAKAEDEGKAHLGTAKAMPKLKAMADPKAKAK